MRSGRIFLWVLAAVLATVGFYYVFWPELSKYLQMGRQKQYLAQRVSEEEDKGLRLKKEREALAQDPVQIEKVAREKLGLSRPREIIYKFEDKTVSQQTTASPISKNQEKVKN